MSSRFPRLPSHQVRCATAGNDSRFHAFCSKPEGFRRGERWVWWTLLLAGIPGYACAIGVHFIVGYKNLWHLTPAFAGLAVFVIAQALSYPYLAAPDPALLDEWQERAKRRDAALLRIASD